MITAITKITIKSPSNLNHLLCSLVHFSLVSLHQINDEPNNQGNSQQSRQGTLTKCTCGDPYADLIDEIRYRITHSQLKSDSAPKPFFTAHFRIHRSDGCKARRGKQVEHQIR